ncbi:hypothetical protein N337_07389, partial [Phoenicopterus ruber ruber]
KYTKFSIFYYWINSLGQKTSICNRSENVVIPSGRENKTATMSYDHRIMPLENTFSTGTYYCTVKWNDIQKMGNGVFVLARGTGYVETSYGWKFLTGFDMTLVFTLSLGRWCFLQMCHLVSCPQQVVCPRRNQINILRQKVETQPPSASPPPPPPVYD